MVVIILEVYLVFIENPAVQYHHNHFHCALGKWRHREAKQPTEDDTAKAWNCRDSARQPGFRHALNYYIFCSCKRIFLLLIYHKPFYHFSISILHSFLFA
jgi:hypothetical protein